ncbi:hypothetical protein EGW08_012564 [Elysia chlorotica]|uniref:Uncharacterized protein n=1 Tax=Elysia chlorotica TaxID=188477 RepID=A0A3S1BAP9_ELYCH|nr:hypothetical protein EGW08_012564 [Elysia chlorotica]
MVRLKVERVWMMRYGLEVSIVTVPGPVDGDVTTVPEHRGVECHTDMALAAESASLTWDYLFYWTWLCPEFETQPNPTLYRKVSIVTVPGPVDGDVTTVPEHRGVECHTDMALAAESASLTWGYLFYWTWLCNLTSDTCSRRGRQAGSALASRECNRQGSNLDLLLRKPMFYPRATKSRGRNYVERQIAHLIWRAESHGFESQLVGLILNTWWGRNYACRHIAHRFGEQKGTGSNLGWHPRLRVRLFRRSMGPGTQTD